MGLVNKDDFDFLVNYSQDYLAEMLSKERLNVFGELFDHGPQYQDIYGSKQQRAYMIDKWFLIAS